MRAANRLARLRAFLAENGLDAIVVRNTTDLMWLTGFERVFDSEQAHVAFVCEDGAIVHTDGRYSTAMRLASADEGVWGVDDSAQGSMAFVAAALEEYGLDHGRVAIDTSMTLAEYRALVQVAPHAQLVERQDDVLELRAVKDAEELERMQRAQDVASAAYEATLEELRPGMTEAQVSLALEIAMRERGADEVAFANIVASGPNSANPHSVPGGRVIQEGDLVVFDFGARVEGYRSDTTRTVSIGAPTEQQRRIYAAVREANEEVEKAIGPGVTGREMHELACQVLADNGFAGKMGHSLGHGVGLDIHEMPHLSPRYDEPLVPGNVVTVEPGAYLAGSDGVRLEDCVAITEDGFRNFCGLSHELRVVE